ncbi:hypothetical protein AVEN_167597-1 [Araneus ventricosus]|uniref:RNase H type-1 domain-containing protein n=1 Tax=Araneus ventricosus TaxID=182803 RepID=A0A4Y2HTW5_ARAVE|nr:hypothetical protein AVEN_167597-1 [Araneus ventricosus]
MHDRHSMVFPVECFCLSSFCVLRDNNWTCHWSAKLNENCTAFQAELIALLEATLAAVDINTTEKISINVDNRAIIQASSNPKSTSTIAQHIFKLLHANPNISVNWIKAHAVYEGNEKADHMAKEATKRGQQYQEVKLPKPILKAKLKRPQELEKWQVGDTGRKVEKFFPRCPCTQSIGPEKKLCSSLGMDHFHLSGIDSDWLQTPCATVKSSKPHRKLYLSQIPSTSQHFIPPSHPFPFTSSFMDAPSRTYCHHLRIGESSPIIPITDPLDLDLPCQKHLCRHEKCQLKQDDHPED